METNTDRYKANSTGEKINYLHINIHRTDTDQSKANSTGENMVEALQKP